MDLSGLREALSLQWLAASIFAYQNGQVTAVATATSSSCVLLTPRSRPCVQVPLRSSRSPTHCQSIRIQARQRTTEASSVR